MLFKAIAQGGPRRALVVVPLALLLACGAAFAQEITGTIYGKVTDVQGLGVPGATVTVTSPDHIKAEVRTTSELGTYRVLRLQPSSNYTVMVELTGFQTATYTEIILRAGQVIAIDATVSPSGVEESVTVVGTSPLVDIKSSQAMRTLERERLENIPLGRDYDDLLTSMAGIIDTEYQFAPAQSVLGSDPRGNLYLIDGAVANDTTVGYILTEIPIDMIEEVQVTTTGQTAEFGMSHGGVFNFVTKSGGNDLSGSAYIYYQGDSLESENLTQEEKEQAGGVGTSVKKDQDFGGTFGGPIKRDTVWFFGNIRRLNVEVQQPLIPTQPFETNQTHSFFKITAQLASATRLYGSITTRNQDRYPSNVTSFRNADDPLTWQTQRRNQYLFGFGLTHLIGTDTIVDARYNRQWKEFVHDIPNNPDAIIGYTDGVTGLEFGGLTGDLYHMLCRCTWGTGANVSHFMENASGSHEFKAGFFVDRPNSERTFSYPNNLDTRQQLSNGAAFRITKQWYPNTQSRNINRYAFFLQDQWTIGDRLTLNVGVRHVNSEGWLPPQSRGGGRWFPVATFQEVRDVINFSTWAPRLGFVYALGEQKRTSVKGYYGRHFKALLTQDLSSVAPSSGGSETYEWNDINGDLQFQEGEEGDLIGSQLNPAINDRSDLADPDMTDSYVDSFHFTVEHEVSSNMVVSVQATVKRERNILETTVIRTAGDQDNPFNDFRTVNVTNQFTGEPDIIYALRPEFRGAESRTILTNPSFADELFRDYEGVEFALRRRFRDGWQAYVSYNWGNGNGNIANDFQGTTSYNRIYDTPNEFVRAVGPLALDAPHQFKLQGTYTLPYDVLLSGFYQAQTGFPIKLPSSDQSIQGTYKQRFYPLCPSGSAGGAKGDGGGGGGCQQPPLGIAGIVVEGQVDTAVVQAGTFRHDFRHKIDLRVEKQFPFGDGMKLGLIVDVFNLGNISRVTSFKSIQLDNSNFLVPGTFENPRIVRLGLRFNF
jgi:outer membrane receptor protein involved in Fe transport